MKSPITTITSAPVYYGSEIKTEVKKTITENNGFTTIEIERQYDCDFRHTTDKYGNSLESKNVAEVKKTTADIFIRTQANANLDDSTRKYGDMFAAGYRNYKNFKSLKHAMNAIPRKLQTEDYRTRELILTIVVWENQTASVYIISE
jgi:hypothetical protein